MRSALARQKKRPWADWASTQVMSDSGTLTFTPEKAPPHIQEVLEFWGESFGAFVASSHIFELMHNGHRIILPALMAAHDIGCQ